MRIESAGHWSNYWARGHLTSLPQDFAANYADEIAAFWCKTFAEVDDGGCIVDVCTGNGAIALLAARFAREQQRHFELVAVDAADIDPQIVAGRHPDEADLVDRIRFIGNQRIESLDLPPETFDLVTSQYGIEYCEWAIAAERIHRVLRRGGQLAVVSHAGDSDMVKTMAREQAQYDVLDETLLLATIGRYIAGRVSFVRLSKVLSSTREQIERAFRQSPVPLYRTVLGAIAGLQQLDEAGVRQQMTNLRRFHDDLSFGRARLEDMMRVNRALQDEEHWLATFSGAGFDLLASGELLQGGQHHAGRYYRFERL